jgi:hypothetical protein
MRDGGASSPPLCYIRTNLKALWPKQQGQSVTGGQARVLALASSSAPQPCSFLRAHPLKPPEMIAARASATNRW